LTPISAPGIYDIDIDDYHSQRCCVGPSVSSGGLRAILGTCPALFWAYSDMNPDRVIRDSPSLALGRAAHALVLGEPEFNAKFVISPFEDFRTKDARLWRDEQTRQVLRKDDFDVIQQMAQAQRASPQCMNAFTDGEPEKSIVWKDEETGLWIKVRPDWLPRFVGIRYTVEYKTALSIKPALLSRDVFKYGYEVQAAMAVDGIKNVLEREPLGIAHVVQEKTAPFLTDLRLFTTEQIDWGRIRYRHALRTLAECIASDRWPAYTANPQFFDTPYYVVKEMENFDGRDGNAESPHGGPDHDAFSAADYLATG
jgi:PDDEXK-like domain of unknown function (DUF3799)